VVRVIHERGSQRIEGEARGLGAGMFLLTDRQGGFFSLGNITKYNGLVCPVDEHLVKSVESIILPGQELETVRSFPGGVERQYNGGAVETFVMNPYSLSYSIEGYSGDLFLDLDMRRLDDESATGRIYAMQQEGEMLLITYEKYTDDNRSQKEYELALAVQGVPHGAFRFIQEWQERRYQYDERRGDSSKLWVFRCGAIRVDGRLSLSLAAGANAAEASARTMSATTTANEKLAAIHSKDGPLPAVVSLDALDSLTVTRTGWIYAGLPWFSQPWSRDELISLGALIRARRYSLAKETILRYAALLGNRNGLDALYPRGGLLAADSLGWLAKRTHDLLLALERHGLLRQHFSRRELRSLRDAIGGALARVASERSVDGLIMNNVGETWMDASYGGDTRQGARIEIQALQLAGYQLCRLLERKTSLLSGNEWRRREEGLSRRVRAAFYSDDRLADGVADGQQDWTQRPNIFLAYYLYPELLPAEEWEAAFDYALSRLWLPWGGLATIEKEHPLFTQRYTGMSNQSYHRGDSWYWLNGLVAVCLHRLDSVKYKEQVEKLRSACVDDLLFQGAVGHCSELSSAAEQEWGGCFSQAWSAAMLYELLTES
jgi:hypothetical protein